MNKGILIPNSTALIIESVDENLSENDKKLKLNLDAVKFIPKNYNKKAAAISNEKNPIFLYNFQSYQNSFPNKNNNNMKMFNNSDFQNNDNFNENNNFSYNQYYYPNNQINYMNNNINNNNKNNNQHNKKLYCNLNEYAFILKNNEHTFIPKNNAPAFIPKNKLTSELFCSKGYIPKSKLNEIEKEKPIQNLDNLLNSNFDLENQKFIDINQISTNENEIENEIKEFKITKEKNKDLKNYEKHLKEKRENHIEDSNFIINDYKDDNEKEEKKIFNIEEIKNYKNLKICNETNLLPKKFLEHIENMKIIEYEIQKNNQYKKYYNKKKNFDKFKNNENNNNNSEIKFNQFENKKEKFEDVQNKIIDEIAAPCAIDNEEIYNFQNNDNNNNFNENNNFSYNQYYYTNNQINYNLNFFNKKRKKKKKKNNF